MCAKPVVVANPFGLNAEDFQINRHELKQLRQIALDGWNFVYETAQKGPRVPLLMELERSADLAAHFLLKRKNPDSFIVQRLMRYRRVLLDHLASHPEDLTAYRLIHQCQGLQLARNQTHLDDMAYLVGLLYVQVVYQISAVLRVAAMHYYRLGHPQATRLLLLHYETQDHLSAENGGASEKLSSLENLAFMPAEQQFKMRCDNGYVPVLRQHDHDPLFAFHSSGALFVGLPGRSYDFDFTLFTKLRQSYPHQGLPMTVLQHDNAILKLLYFDRAGIQRKLTVSYLYLDGYILFPRDSNLDRSNPFLDDMIGHPTGYVSSDAPALALKTPDCVADQRAWMRSLCAVLVAAASSKKGIGELTIVS